MSAETYFAEIRRQLTVISETQTPAITRASEVMADAIAEGGVIHVFGPGHAYAMAEEMWHRAGGLIPISPILDPDLLPWLASPSKQLLLENLGVRYHSL